MRNIATFQELSLAKRFSDFLKSQGIENRIEASSSIDEPPSFLLWCYDEDQISSAKKFLEEFLQNPFDAKYEISSFQEKSFEKEPPNGDEEEQFLKEVLEEEPSEEEAVEEKEKRSFKKSSFFLTSFFLNLCIAIFLLNFFQETKESKIEGIEPITPIQSYLLYDLPQSFVEMNLFVEKHPEVVKKKISELPPKLKQELEKVESIPSWKGLGEKFFPQEKSLSLSKAPPPLFEKIREGEAWRLISPCFLHTQFLHILFNMIWLVLLGRQIEERLSRGKYLLLVLIVGAFSNTVQYLMSGPYFLGYSGIVMGMVGFIWSRQRKAPWEGYPLQKSTILFLLFFIFAMMALQFFSFLLTLLGTESFFVSIANSAHISGALVGALLGRLSFFSWRTHES